MFYINKVLCGLNVTPAFASYIWTYISIKLAYPFQWWKGIKTMRNTTTNIQ